MKKIFCAVDERFVNPLFEVFDGGDFILSSWRDIEEDKAEMRIFFEEGDPRPALKAALEIVGVEAEIRECEVPDEDWKFAYRRHFKIENIGRRLVTVPAWEKIPEGDRLPIVLDPGMAFGTGKHETTRACLEFIDEAATCEGEEVAKRSFLDMGCGSGILSIAAKKLGFGVVEGFDVDQEAVDASVENAAKNGVEVRYEKFALGRNGACEQPVKRYDFVVANILGPLLIRFADEIVRYAGNRLIVSGILTELYPEVLAAYTARGFRELGRKTIGEWTTGLLGRV